MNRFYISALLILLALGCAPSTPPQPPQPPPEQDMAVVVHDFESPDQMVEAVRVECNGILKGFTDADGYVEFQVPQFTKQDCVLTKDNYEDSTASHYATPEDAILATWIKRMAPPPPPPHPGPLQGRLRIEGNCFRDDTGCVNPVYAHAGDVFSKYVRDPGFVRRQLDLVAQAGYHGVRVWSTLGGTYWAGREVGPAITPDYWGQLRQFFGDLKARNLRAVFSQGDIGQLGGSRRAFMETVAALDNELQVVDFLDCGNEAWQTGEPSPTRLAECVGYYRSAGGKALLTLTSPPGEEKAELDAFSITPADAYDVHGYRGGRFWDKIRHIFSIAYEIKPAKRFGIQSEPFGNGALVSVTANKSELNGETMALAGTMSTLARQAWVWFSGEGVKLDRGLETESGFFETPRAVRLLPNDLATFSPLFHSGTTWVGTRYLIPPREDVRVDGAQSGDGRVVMLVYGPGGTYTFPTVRNFEGKLCNPATAECEDIRWRASATVELTFSRGRILIGRTF